MSYPEGFDDVGCCEERVDGSNKVNSFWSMVVVSMSK